MKKLGLLWLATVMALGALGIGYAAWTDTIFISGTVNTGSLDIEVVNQSNTWVWKDLATDGMIIAHQYEYDPDNRRPPTQDSVIIAYADADCPVGSPALPDDTVLVTFNNLFPLPQGVAYVAGFLLHYSGSIPAKVSLLDVVCTNPNIPFTISFSTATWDPDNPAIPPVKGDPIAIEDIQMHYCDYILVEIGITIPQDNTLMNQTGDIIGTIEVKQWNMVSGIPGGDTPGTDEIPIVKCKWEQDNSASEENGDPTHADPGSSFLPPLVKDGKWMIKYYAVVTDEEDGGAVAQVYADVFHPAGSPPPYSTSTDPRGNLFKYEVPFNKLGYGTSQQTLVTNAYNMGLISFTSPYGLAEVIEEMQKGTADLWMGQAEIDYEQPAGDYDVNVYAVDTNNNQSAVLLNQFLYVPVCGIEIDFTGIVYGSVNLGVEKMIAGDTIFVSPAELAGAGQANKATVRNIGNTWAHVTISESDMGFGKDVTGMWNVSFDARMGNDNANRVVFDPDLTVELPNYLGLSSQDELDFSILVKNGFGTHTGTMTTGCSIEPFTSPPPPINAP